VPITLLFLKEWVDWIFGYPKHKDLVFLKSFLVKYKLLTKNKTITTNYRIFTFYVFNNLLILGVNNEKPKQNPPADLLTSIHTDDFDMFAQSRSVSYENTKVG